MKNKILTWLLYGFIDKLLTEYFEIDVYLFAANTDFDRKISMINPPAIDTVIAFEDGYFLVKSIISEPHGSVLRITGTFEKNDFPNFPKSEPTNS